MICISSDDKYQSYVNVETTSQQIKIWPKLANLGQILGQKQILMVQYPFLYTRSIKCFQHPMAYKKMKSAFLKIKVWPNWANYDQILGQSLATKLNLSKFKKLNS